MRFLPLVVERRALLQQRRQPRRRHRPLVLQLCELLGESDHVAAVAVGHGEQGLPALLVDRQFPPERFLGPREQRRQGIVVEAAQDEHLAARQERGVQLEGRVLGGGADQGYRPILDIGQEAVLLGAVEAMNLVDEQERALAVLAALAGPLEHAAQVGHPGEDGRQRLEMQVHGFREQAGDGGLAAPRWPPQDQRAEFARLQHTAERPLGPEQVILAEDLVQRLGTQAFGQRRRGERGEEFSRHDDPTLPPAQRNWTGNTTPSRPTLMLLIPLATRFLSSATFFTSWPLTARIMSPGRTKRLA